MGSFLAIVLGSVGIPRVFRGDSRTPGQLSGGNRCCSLPISISPPQNFPILSSNSAETGLVLFPYSIIPGGAHSSAELQQALANDPVAARHYAGFSTERARVIHLSEPRAVYVSYRVGNRVFWTRNRMKLPRGEAVLTDGVYFARTRCGNRISDVPKEPVSASEPAAEVFETPLDPASVLVTPPPFDLPLTGPPNTEIHSFAENRNPPGEGYAIPPFIFLPSSPGGPSGGAPVVPPPIAPSPEPGTLFLISTGLSGLWFFRRKRVN